MRFDVGRVVRLASGGPGMTVTAVREAAVVAGPPGAKLREQIEHALKAARPGAWAVFTSGDAGPVVAVAWFDPDDGLHAAEFPAAALRPVPDPPADAAAIRLAGAG